MKNLLLGSALALSTLAVMMPVQNVMAQDASVATVGSVGKGYEAVYQYGVTKIIYNW